MPKMKEVKRTKKAKPAKNSTTYTNADGIKVTVCEPGPSPKLVTAKGKG
jgi:hypothetical protein